MGFSISMFFEDLRRIQEKDIDEVDMLAELEACIDEARQYAYECNQISTK